MGKTETSATNSPVPITVVALTSKAPQQHIEHIQFHIILTQLAWLQHSECKVENYAGFQYLKKPQAGKCKGCTL